MSHPPAATPTASPIAAVRPAQLTPAYVERLLSAADAMRAELDNLRELADARRYHLEQIDRELKLAARLQGEFLPRRLPELGCLRFHAFHKAAGHVSGDMYGVDRLDEHHVGVHLVDAVGHGMPAALLAMFLQHAVEQKEIVPEGRGYRLLDPEETLARLNRTLCGQDLSSGFFATAACCRCDARTGEIALARAGHPLPLHVTADGARPVASDGALLGILPEESFESTRLTLASGDRLVLITDGAEALFADDRYGDPAAWLAGVERRRHLAGAAFIDAVAGAASDATDDDVTVLVIERV